MVQLAIKNLSKLAPFAGGPWNLPHKFHLFLINYFIREAQSHQGKDGGWKHKRIRKYRNLCDVIYLVQCRAKLSTQSTSRVCTKPQPGPEASGWYSSSVQESLFWNQARGNFDIKKIKFWNAAGHHFIPFEQKLWNTGRVTVCKNYYSEVQWGS